MIYRSNLTAPDLRPHFRLKDPPIQIMGHDIPSDPDFEPQCGFWSDDEAAILYNVAKQTDGDWFDIGSRFCWTTSHIADAISPCRVIGIDPIYNSTPHYLRAVSNINRRKTITLTPDRVALCGGVGCVIDGCHDAPEPLNDAQWAAHSERGHKVILLHDYWGLPIRDAANWLVSQGWQRKVYFTPNGVCCCWRGLPDFVSPDHVRDPSIDWRGIERMLAE